MMVVKFYLSKDNTVYRQLKEAKEVDLENQLLRLLILKKRLC